MYGVKSHVGCLVFFQWLLFQSSTQPLLITLWWCQNLCSCHWVTAGKSHCIIWLAIILPWPSFLSFFLPLCSMCFCVLICGISYNSAFPVCKSSIHASVANHVLVKVPEANSDSWIFKLNKQDINSTLITWLEDLPEENVRRHWLCERVYVCVCACVHEWMHTHTYRRIQMCTYQSFLMGSSTNLCPHYSSVFVVVYDVYQFLAIRHPMNVRKSTLLEAAVHAPLAVDLLCIM